MVGFSRFSVLTALCVLSFGCEDPQVKPVPKISIESGLAVAPELTFAPVEGDLDALPKISALVKSSGVVLNPIIQKPSKDWVAGDKANLVASGGEFLTQIEPIIEKRWQLPPPSAENLNFVGYVDIKNACRFLVAYADAVDEGGNPEYAIRALKACRNLAMRLYESSTSFISQLVGNAIDAIAERAIRQIVIRGSMSSAELAQLQQPMVSPDPARSGLSQAIRGEWTLFFVPTVATTEFPPHSNEMTELFNLDDDDLVNEIKGNSDPFDRLKTIETFAPYFRIAISELEGGGISTELSRAKLAEILNGVPIEESEVPAWAKKTPNAVGLLIGQASLGVWDSAFEAAVKCGVSRNLTEVVVAAQRGLAESGSLPRDMAELRKYGLSDSVKDAYSGKDFFYDPVRGLAWSVGPDGKDNGGKDQVERWSNDTKDRVVIVK